MSALKGVLLDMLKEIYESFNLKRCRLTKFEEYDFYADKKDFLNSTNKSILTFTDLNGSLMAMRPDITLSVIRKGLPGKWFYNERVYRPDQNSGHFREFPQSGIEILGDLSGNDVQQVIEIALKCLEVLAGEREYVLDIADNAVVAKILKNHPKQSAILNCLSQRNQSGLKELEAPDELAALLTTESLSSFEYNHITKSSHIKVDYSAVNNLNYYNGIVFKGFIEGIPSCVLSGGQYDGILRAMNSGLRNGMGFAIFLDRLGVEYDD